MFMIEMCVFASVYITQAIAYGTHLVALAAGLVAGLPMLLLMVTPAVVYQLAAAALQVGLHAADRTTVGHYGVFGVCVVV